MSSSTCTYREWCPVSLRCSRLATADGTDRNTYRSDHTDDRRDRRRHEDLDGSQPGGRMRDLNDQPEQPELPREGRGSVALPGTGVLTLAETAQLLRVHPETVRRHAFALGGIKVGRVWRFVRERLQSGRACAPGIGDKLWQSGSAV